MSWTAMATMLAAAVLGAGCGSQVLDAGSNDTADAAPAEGRRREFPPPSNSFRCVPGHESTDCWGTPCIGDVPTDLADAFTGQFIDAAFPSGSRAVRISVDGRGSSADSPGLCGTVTFGAAEAPPVSTDPEAFPQAYAGWESHAPIEGFVYEFWTDKPLPHADTDGTRRIQIGLLSRQVYKSWCDIQLSYPQQVEIPLSRYTYGCLPPHLGVQALPLEDGGRSCAYFVGHQTKKPVSCAQVELCGLDPTCTCFPEGCSVNRDIIGVQNDITLDLKLSSSTGSGIATWEGQSETFELDQGQ